MSDPPNRPTEHRTQLPTDDAVLRTDPAGHVRPPTHQSRRGGAAKGSLIHHAPTRTIGPLMVPMILSPSQALLVLATGGA